MEREDDTIVAQCKKEQGRKSKWINASELMKTGVPYVLYIERCNQYSGEMLNLENMVVT